jgi:hypothetical protein
MIFLFLQYLIKFSFLLISLAIGLHLNIFFKSFTTNILVIFEINPHWTINILISIFIFLIIKPLKKQVDLALNHEKTLFLNTNFAFAGGFLTCINKISENPIKMQEFFQNPSKIVQLLNEDALFLNNKSNSWQERNKLLREGVLFEQNISNENWRIAVKEARSQWCLTESSKNSNTFYNLLSENIVINGASSLFFSRGYDTVYKHNEIPLIYRNQLSGKTPDCIAITSGNPELSISNIFDVKNLANKIDQFSIEHLKKYTNLSDTNKFTSYQPIYNPFRDHKEFITKFLQSSRKESLDIENKSLVYCASLETVLEVRQPSDLKGFFNTKINSFKTFEDIIKEYLN